MSSCTCGGCTSSTRKASNATEEDQSILVESQPEDSHVICTRIVLDEQGTILDGKNVRFFCMPSLPKPRIPGNPTQAEKAEFQRVTIIRNQWIHALGRADKLPKTIRICSLHFAPSAYDMLSPMKCCVNSLLEVPTRHLLLPDAVPTENLVSSSKKSVLIKTSRAERMTKRQNIEIVNDAVTNR